MNRGSPANILHVWGQVEDWEKDEGQLYYPRQRDRLHSHAVKYGKGLSQVIAAFAVLSPNNDERSNYIALNTCLQIDAGIVGSAVKVRAYGRNTTKALAILKGEPIDQHLKGLKVRAFWANTLNPATSEEVTIDGHMLGVWVGQRLRLKREAEVPKWEYPLITADFKQAASRAGWPVVPFQASIWLAWKRINRIVWSPQMKFDWHW